MNQFSLSQNILTYHQYLILTETLLAEGKTTGSDQSAEMLEYTRLNLHRMRRWDKTLQLLPEIVALAQTQEKQDWWVITEPWCGDSAQILPFINAIALASNGKIELKIILRDEHPDLMDQYLTNGTRGIPKLVAFSAKGEPLFVWGPRPAETQQMVLNLKQQPDYSYDKLKTEIHLWYSKNKGIALQAEFKEILSRN
ncbi:MAG: thioredoxin family protein [Bacteroidetes bacterium]|nr:thioredoxin family protein [Bacteroidota bacterium]MBS1739103.1 thioredoxin family protein [Bacteroidota bacterium]MBS1777208.1 thioredoxin family protein [Bacteroidota bacterium]